MDGGVDGLHETGVGIDREVHGQCGARRRCAPQLQVEHDFAVGPARVGGWAVCALPDGHGRHRRHGHAQLLEVRTQTVFPVAAAAFDKRNALARAVALRKAVELRELHRCVRRGGDRTRGPDASRLSRPGRQRHEAAMRLRLWARVEPQCGNNHVLQ